MTMTLKGGRAAAAILIAATLATAVAPGVAQADHSHRGNVAAAAVGAGALGLILGSAAANANAGPRDEYYEEERVYRRPRRCWTERREFEDRYGDIRIRRVQVCN